MTVDTASDFDLSIARMDPQLFAAIPSQTTNADKQSLLACQLAIRSSRGSYNYLEIGSYLGGSLQPHVMDPLCASIVSIDKRPTVHADEGGVSNVYAENSTTRMLDNLRAISPAGTDKIHCIDADAAAIDVARISTPPDLCLIDGEHTDTAVQSDYAFCRRVVAPNGAIVFHDANIVYRGLFRIMQALRQEGADFRAYALPDSVFVIEFDALRLHECRPIHDMLINNHQAYLASLRMNDHYRQFANRLPFRMLRQFKSRLTGSRTYR
jgi:hypothetical protein